MSTNQDPTKDKNELEGFLGTVVDLLKKLLESLKGPTKEDRQPGKSNN